MRYIILFAIVLVAVSGFEPKPKTFYDVIIRNGTIYDGSGSAPYAADLAIQHDTIAFIGALDNAEAAKEFDATGLAVAPGFINMLSWADKSLLMDGRSMSDIKQGVTLEVFGEGFSPGPERRIGRVRADSLWTTLGGYFEWAMKKGVSTNIASFVGATSVRIHELGQENRKPAAKELHQMKQLVKQAMEEGAMGLGTSLIYAPASFATTEELIALSEVVSEYNGMYITHLRSEGDFILPALDEAIRIGKVANVPVEIYHLKINIERNWDKIDQVIHKIDSARKSGVVINANMYPYTASATGLTSRLPSWILAGGAKEMRRRLRNASVRNKVLDQMRKGVPYKNSDPSYVQITGFRLDSLNNLYKGKRLNEIASLHGKSADETTLDLIVQDKSRIECIYFLQSEANLRKIIQLPYVSFGSDAGSVSLHDDFEEWSAHPRAYGTFARVLGKYVREEKLITLEDAIRRMTFLPASNLKIKKRGLLKPGFYGDVAIFDKEKIKDLATFEGPRQYATGMIHVFVNGVAVLQEGEHTGEKPGRVVHGPGWKGANL